MSMIILSRLRYHFVVLMEFMLFNNHVFLLPGQMFVLHLAEWNALQGLFQQLLGLHVDPLGH